MKALLFLLVLMSPALAVNQTLINEMALKLNVSNDSLNVLFNITPPETYNKTEIDNLFASYNYSLEIINSSVNLQQAKLLSSLLDIYVNASITNASHKIAPAITTLRDDVNIRFDAVLNSTIHRGELQRNILDLNQSLVTLLVNENQATRYALGQEIRGNFLLAVFLIVVIPAAIFIGVTRIHNIRMKMLGTLGDFRASVIEDLGLNPMSTQDIQNRRQLKLKIIKKKLKPDVTKKLLEMTDNDEIGNENAMEDALELLMEEEKLHEKEYKHETKRTGKGKRK